MKKRTWQAATALTLGCAAFAGNALADTPASSPWYGTAQIGGGRLVSSGVMDQALAGHGLTSSSSLNQNDTALTLTLGYQLSPNLAVEGGFKSFSRYGYTSAISAPAADSVGGGWKSSGLQFAVVGLAPLNKDFELFAKAGAFFSNTRFDETSPSGITPAISESASRTAPMIGFGVNYNITPEIAAVGEWDRYMSLGNAATTGRTSVDSYSVGMKYRF